MTNHRNDEREVNCPVDGCDATPLARGLHLHIRQTSGDGHGPRGTVPEAINTDDLETVGEREVEMDYPEERDTENVARLCPYCQRPYKGQNGVLIHLGQVAGRRNHPEDAAEKHSEGDFPVVEVDERGNVLTVKESVDPPDYVAGETDTVPVQRVFHLVARLLADNRPKVARRVRHHLLGAENIERPIRKVPPHRELYEALLSRKYADDSDDSLSATIQDERIQVACAGESARLTADEARDVAAGLEGSSAKDDEIANLIEFLQYGADLIERNQQKPRTTEFDNWQ